MVQAVRSNQWVVSGEKLSPEQLDKVVLTTFQNTARCLYDLYHNLHNPQAADRLIRCDAKTGLILKRSQERQEGILIVGLHMSNFDFVLQSSSKMGLRALGITLPNLKEGYQVQYDLRAKAGVDIKPASPGILKEAVRRMRAGETVMTGIDRPVSDSKYHPKFFGRPTDLPVFHIQMALMAKVPVYVAAAILQPDGVYEVSMSDPVFMQPHPDRQLELMENAERVLAVAEDFICRAPQQWAMFYPVWPGVIIP
jgi:KDO2-lipid IV(A) lauroyltransferase